MAPPGTHEEDAEGGPTAAVLGRLLVIQQAIDAMPDEQRIAGFVRRALGGFPGIADAWDHLEGHTRAPNPHMAALLARCQRELPAAPTRNFLRQSADGAQCFLIETPGQRFGWLVLQVDDDAALAPYLPFLSNISSTISRIVASRQYQARLTSLNQALQEARDHLEQRVAERTRELEYRATHDPLTGLANRALLIDRLRGAIAGAQRDGADAELLLRRANSAMHRAKASGKDNIQFYASARDAAVAERMELETELRQAIPAGELVVHYQPKLELASGSAIGAEALVRWAHPQRGLLAPDSFIPLAEDSALIVALGERVLLQACRQTRAWQAAGLDGKSVAVNVAARQVLRETGLAPGCLELEVTESSIMHDLAHASWLLHELKGLGVSISIDDFGTGYSSLSALRNFPADKLKIDRSFVHEIETVPSAAAVALAVISFAKTLGMRVNAEGVETQGQARFLKQHGCDEIQGYLLARPVPPEQVEALLRQPDTGAWNAAA
jgi:EAL domain-containing protein (putative c-di-GMP-specific phosphodiesterase class I)